MKKNLCFIILCLVGILVLSIQSFASTYERLTGKETGGAASFPAPSTLMKAERIEKPVKDTEELNQELKLYALSACLIDASSGRVLYGKDENKKMPMASTTKIMTCILALELADPDELVEISSYAASMQKVKLYVKKGEQYRLGDLLYSLMLESHNDTAVAIAEHIGSKYQGKKVNPSEATEAESKEAVKKFADLMNQKAKELQCFQTYFITPNGLDAKDIGKRGEEKIHSTTALELSIIMSYCILNSPKKEDFLSITRTSSYSFQNNSATRNFSVNNKNAFLHMMDGALSGKTGFTGAAGYCYVGALQQDGRTFVVTLLGCGWPNNKSYKWADTRILMNYGLDHFQYFDFGSVGIDESRLAPLEVNFGQTKYYEETALVSLERTKENFGMLVREGEEIEVIYDLPQAIKAPVKAGTKIGSIQFKIGNKVWKTDSVVLDESIEEIDLPWCLQISLGAFCI